MKVTVAALLATLAVASAGITPELSVSVNSKDANELTGRFDSSMKWSTEGSYAGTNYEVRQNNPGRSKTKLHAALNSFF
jgi:hypothetical protein